MKEKADLESYLLDLGQDYEEVGEGIYILRDEFEEIDDIVITWSPPMVIFRVKLVELPDGDHATLMRKLLELNATEMIAGAYGLEGNTVVAVDILQSENLDYNEFLASIEALAMAIKEHYPVIKAAIA